MSAPEAAARTAPAPPLRGFAVLEATRGSAPFSFEQSASALEALKKGTARRSASEAAVERDALVRRLSLGQAAGGVLQQLVEQDPELDRLLLRWATELPLNVAWYQAALKRKWLGQRLLVALVVVLTTGTMAAVVALSLRGGGGSGVVSAQLTFAVTAVFLALQVMAKATDQRAQISAFWEAAASLKESVYRLEEDWAGRTWDHPEVIKFKAALKEAIRLARQETRKERAAFFKTLQSPTEALDSAMAALGALQGSKTTFEKARDAALKAQHEEALAQDAAGSPDARKALDLRVALEVRGRELAAARGRLRELEWVKEAEAAHQTANPEVNSDVLDEARARAARAEAAWSKARGDLLDHLKQMG